MRIERAGVRPRQQNSLSPCILDMTTAPTVDTVIGDIDDRLHPTGDVHRRFAEAVRRLLITRAWSVAPETTLFSCQDFERLKPLVAGRAALSHNDADLLKRVLLYRCWKDKTPTVNNDLVQTWFENEFEVDHWRIPSLPTAEELALSKMNQRELSVQFRDTLLEAQRQYKALQDVHQRSVGAIERSLTKLDSSILHRSREIPTKEKTLWSRLWDL